MYLQNLKTYLIIDLTQLLKSEKNRDHDHDHVVTLESLSVQEVNISA